MSELGGSNVSEEFTSIFDLISGFGSKTYKIEEIASAIEEEGVYCFDDYHRYSFGEPNSQIANHALSSLADFFKTTWTMSGDDLSYYLGQFLDNYHNRPDLYLYGWHGELPKFSELHQEWLKKQGVKKPPVMKKEPRSDAKVYCLVAARLEDKLSGDEYVDFLRAANSGSNAAKVAITDDLKLFGETITGPTMDSIINGSRRFGINKLKNKK
jgi:hypothetical protein